MIAVTVAPIDRATHIAYDPVGCREIVLFDGVDCRFKVSTCYVHEFRFCGDQRFFEYNQIFVIVRRIWQRNQSAVKIGGEDRGSNLRLRIEMIHRMALSMMRVREASRCA